MQFIEHFPPIEKRAEPPWQRYLLDSILAITGVLLITYIIYIFQLYPRIPNISIVYLLVVLALASTRGRFSAILASVVAFLSFDFFLVPPLYGFTIYRAEEWIALCIFLVDALLTGQLAVLLRQRAQEAARREHETRILYELVRTTNEDERLEQQLHTIARAIITIFAPWGVRECALLLPDAQGTLTIQASAPRPLNEVVHSPDVQAMARQVMKEGQAMGLHDIPLVPRASMSVAPRVVIHSSVAGRAARVRLIPLKTNQQVVGVLSLRIQGEMLPIIEEDRLAKEQVHSNARTAFFWTFLEQATLIIERARLRRENMRIEVLQRTDALRASLLSSVSHDLRTPLASIKAAASSLQQEDVSWDEETRRSFAQTIEREADRLNRLVGNLLDMSRIEGGALKPEKEMYQFADLVQDVLTRLQPLLRGRAVQTDLPDDLPPLEFDYVMMDQVLTNLLENAVRYTPPGSPIDIRVRHEGSQLITQVADRSPGIPQADLERVFDKFYRVQQSQRPGHPMGTGLGLAVSKGLVEAHAGRIWAEPREGGGTVFSMTLPIDVKNHLYEPGYTHAD
jgi:two-component system sensor histidine kinase KdpD